MFTLGSSLRFQLYSKATDMRKSFDGLCGLVQNQLGQPSTNGDVYVFINKARNKIKLLHWSGNSFVLYYKRLESGTFEHPKYDIQTGSYQLSYVQIVMLVDGISIKNIERKKHYTTHIKPSKTLV
ncbi:MAG: IS66 family insertion sequence element accessory protein TnpB [Proteobacteria bacterium]|nr:IS66 family insertion sequence element accessory protein TnpB [Pseudomonadota bacterium]